MTGLRDVILGVLAIAPEEHAVEFETNWLTWGAFERGIARIGGIVGQAGGTGLRLGVMLRNRPEFIPAILQPLISERCLVTLNPVYPDDRLLEDIRATQCPVLIGTPDDWRRPGVQDAARAGGALGVAAESAGDGSLKYEILLKPSPELWPNGYAGDVAIEMMTSGTTGTPKRIPLRRSNFEKAARDWAAFEKGREGAEPKLRSGVTLLTAPFAHIAGVGALINTVTAGRKACLIERFTLDNFHDAIVRHRPKVASGPPAILRMLLDAGIPPEDLSSIVVFRSGTAPLDPSLAKEFTDHFGIPVLQNYGATEFGGGVAGWTFDDYKTFGAEKSGSVGRLNDGIEGRIVDPETGEVRSAGEAGALELKASHLGDGLNWVRTSDLAVIDGDGFVFILGRADGSINRGGYKVLAEDVVRALEAHPDIAEAAVVGIDDQRLGQVPAAAYTLVPGAESPGEEELKSFLKQRLAPYQIPARFLAVTELPRTPSFKVDQAAIRAQFEPEGTQAEG